MNDEPMPDFSDVVGGSSSTAPAGISPLMLVGIVLVALILFGKK
jgi:hypothetical protein